MVEQNLLRYLIVEGNWCNIEHPHEMLVQDNSIGKLSAENVISTFLPGKSFSDYVYEWTIANLIDDVSIGDVRLWPKADIRTESNSAFPNGRFGEKSGRSAPRSA